MKDYLPKTTMFAIGALCFGIIISSAFFIYIRYHAPPILTSGPYVISESTRTPINKNEWSKTAMYINKKYGYIVTYPSSTLFVDAQTPEKVYLTDRINGVVALSRIAIIVESTTYSSPDEWLKVENERRHHSMAYHGFYVDDVVEKRIKISGYDAMVTYPRDEAESFPDEKTVLFIKDHNLFRISTGSIDHERIWNSFKFEK